MNEQAHASALQPRRNAGLAADSVDQAAALLNKLFRRVDGHLELRLWDGTLLQLGTASHHQDPEPRYTLICRSPSVVRSMVLGRDPLRMAAYGGLSVAVSGSSLTFAWNAPTVGGAPRTYWLDAGSSVGSWEASSPRKAFASAEFSRRATDSSAAVTRP